MLPPLQKGYVSYILLFMGYCQVEGFAILQYPQEYSALQLKAMGGTKITPDV